jgi:hypothetical protein
MAMSEGNQIQRAYAEKMRLFLEAIRRVLKEPIMLSPEAARACIARGIDPSDTERVLVEAQNALGEFFPQDFIGWRREVTHAGRSRSVVFPDRDRVRKHHFKRDHVLQHGCG